MVFMMIINLLSGVNPSVVRAEENVYFKNGDEKQENGITISKNIVNYDKKTGVYDIELKVKGSSEKIQDTKPLDVVLVMDTSNNMKNIIGNAREAAKNVVDKLITNNTAKNVKMSIVSFADKGKKEIALTNNANDLKNAIAKLNASGGAFTQNGIEVASDILNKAPANNKKVMILVSNGEPNIANGIHPDFGEKEKKFSRIYKPTDKLEGYEQWYGDLYYWHGKGYNKDERNYLVWLRNGLFGNGTKETQGKGHISWPYELMDEYFNNATIKAAEKIKQNTEIITVGIGIKNNRLAKLIMNNLATSGKYLETDSTGSELDKLLDSIAEKFKSKVYEGVITDPMSEYVDYVEDSATLDGKKDGVDYKIENNILKVTNVVLGDNEELTLKYQVKLKDNWKDGEFHPANGETTLTPTPTEKPMMFNVPKLRADAAYVSIKFEKKWIGEVPTGVESVNFIISANGEVIKNNINPIKVSGPGWTTRLENLPKYEGGREIKYTATEESGENYKLKGYLAPQVGADGVITFTAENINTEKVNITVTKKWVNTPDEFQTDVEVELWSRVDNEKFSKNTNTTGKIVKDEAKYTFSNLNKYDSNGKLIEYLVKEKDVDENGNLKKEDHSFKVDVKPTGGNNYDWTITNTCNAITKMIEFTLVKVWDTVPDESVKPEFTIKATAGNWNDNSSITLPIKKEGYYNTEKLEGGKIWKTKIPALKYSRNNIPITYTIEEEKLNGYESTPNGPQKIENEGTVTFTNRELHKDKFTVHKTWKGEPAGSVKFGLYDGNSKVDELELTDKDAQVTSQNFWSGEFKNDHPVRNLNGEVIKYEVKELENNQPVENEVKLGNRNYKVEIRSSENNVFNFTNTDITKGDVQIKKTWVGTEGKAKFGLFKNGDEKISNKEPNLTKTSIDRQYTVKFENVSLTDEEGNAVKYEIKELGDNDNILNTDDTVSLDGRKYKVSYDASGNITNTELIDITVKKTWADNVPQSEQQSVTVGVFKNDSSETVKVKEIELKDGDWTGKFEDLPYVEGGYQVKETKINGVNVDESLKKLYNINVENGTGIKTSGEVKVANSFNLPKAEEGKIKVLKQWAVNPTKEITVKLYKKTVATPAAPSIWEEVEAKQLNNGSVFETEFTEPTDAEDYQILETAIDNLALTENEIQSILNADDLDTIQYKIGDYEVSIQALDDDVFFIKNTNDNLLTEVTATKLWSARTIEKHKKPVKVQLFAETNGVLKAIGSPVELKSDYEWSTKFKGLDKYDEGNEIKYYVAEVGTEKTNITLDDITNGYKLGNSNVTITGNASDGFVITNDVNLIDITAKKEWGGQVAAKTVEFSLYKKTEDKPEFVERKTLSADSNWETVFEVAGEENNQKIEYQVFETAIDEVNINIDPTVATDYTTGTINNGTYAVVITKDEASGVITVRNTFIPNPVGPVIPGGNTPVIPGGNPIIPPVVPTPNPTTPTIIVPDDSTPQGPSSPGNNSGEDGNTNGDEDDGDNGFEEIDEDDIPQDGNIDNTDDADDADDNNEEETTDIADNKAPKGTPKLPKTGGETGDFLSIIGLGLIGLGLVIRRRR